MKYGETNSIRLLDKFLDSLRFACALVEIKDVSWKTVAIFKEANHEDGDVDHLILMSIEQTPVMEPNTLLRSMESTQSTESEFVPPPPPQHDDPQNIMKLVNDDCLVKIFEYLPPNDLGSAADVCERFKAAADKVSKKLFSKNALNYETLLSLECSLRHFNNHIKGVHLNSSHTVLPNAPNTQNLFEYPEYTNLEQAAALLILATYFNPNQNKLDSLVISGFKVHPTWNPFLIPIVSRLKRLDLIQCKTNGLLFHCHQLRTLFLNTPLGSIDATAAFLADSFDNLKEIIIVGDSVELLRKCIVIPTVKRLSINMTSDLLQPGRVERYFESLMRSICTFFPNLEQLFLDSLLGLNAHNRRLRLEIPLSRLKKIDLRCDSNSNNLIILGMARGGLPIEFLRVNPVDQNTIFNIEQLRRIKTLVLEDKMETFFNEMLTIMRALTELDNLYLQTAVPLKMADIKEILKRSDRLVKLNISVFRDTVISEKDYDDITEFIKVCGQERGLKVKICHILAKVTVNVPQEKYQQNRDFFEISREHLTSDLC